MFERGIQTLKCNGDDKRAQPELGATILGNVIGDRLEGNKKIDSALSLGA